MTTTQTTGEALPESWAPIPGLTASGAPSAVLSSTTGLIYVLARDAEGVIHVAVETGQGSGQWQAWIPASTDAETYPTDPTPYSYTNGEGTHTAYLVRTRDNQVRSFCLINEVSLLARPGARWAATKVNPRFEQHNLPQPPS